MTSGKTGIYGGTFDPPHNGHVRAARDFIDLVGLDRLYIVPTAIPPHKQSPEGDDPGRRLEMANLAFGDIPRVRISACEVQSGEVSYSYRTVSEFAKHCTDLYLLVGDDMFLSLDCWRRPEVIFSLCTIVGFLRREDAGLRQRVTEAKRSYEEKYGARILLPENSVYDTSSTQVREMLRSGADTGDVLPLGVAEYIKKHGLYR